MRALRRILGRFARGQQGSATIEFVLLFPVVMYPFMMAMEMGFIQIRQAMIERGMDIAVRELRLGDPTLADPDNLKARVCAEILVVPNCADDLLLAMTSVAVVDFAETAGDIECVDRTEEANPDIDDHDLGATNEMMLLEFCVLHDPIFPSFGLGKILPKEPGGGFALTASTFFVNEPR